MIINIYLYKQIIMSESRFVSTSQSSQSLVEKKKCEYCFTVKYLAPKKEKGDIFGNICYKCETGKCKQCSYHYERSPNENDYLKQNVGQNEEYF